MLLQIHSLKMSGQSYFIILTQYWRAVVIEQVFMIIRFCWIMWFFKDDSCGYWFSKWTESLIERNLKRNQISLLNLPGAATVGIHYLRNPIAVFNRSRTPPVCWFTCGIISELIMFTCKTIGDSKELFSDWFFFLC